MGGREFFIGVDLGKLRDHSAICVIDREYVKEGWNAVFFCDDYREVLTVKHLEQVQLGTSYPRVVHRVKDLAQRASLLGKVSVVVDATGVGDPVVDMMRLAKIEGELVPVKITSGEHATRSNGDYMVPKADLIVGLQMMIARDMLGIAGALELRRELMDELLKIGPELRATGSGHDDLVIAVALACWRLRDRKVCGEMSQPLL